MVAFPTSKNCSLTGPSFFLTATFSERTIPDENVATLGFKGCRYTTFSSAQRLHSCWADVPAETLNGDTNREIANQRRDEPVRDDHHRDNREHAGNHRDAFLQRSPPFLSKEFALVGYKRIEKIARHRFVYPTGSCMREVLNLSLPETPREEVDVSVATRCMYNPHMGQGGYLPINHFRSN